MKAQMDQAACAATRRWEEAGSLLSSALQSYFDSCTHLENKYRMDDGTPTDIVSRIDSTLDSLHIRLDQQLAQSRSTLARTRNRRASPLFRLPAETLIELFLDVLFVPTAAESRVFPEMGSTAKTIYRRLHALSGVCTAWRDTINNCKAAWHVVPLIDHESLGHKRLTTDLSLQRGGNTLHLVAIRTQVNELDGLEHISEHAHRFSSANICSTYSRDIQDILRIFFESKRQTKLSELSICAQRSFDCYYTPELYDTEPASQALFGKLIESLSILRLCGASIHWNKATFSARLTQLQLYKVNLEQTPQLIDFLGAASSAPELRHLNISTIRVITGETPPTSYPVFSFKKLQSLFLDVLDYHVLQVILGSIAPGSHRVSFLDWGGNPYIYPSQNECRSIPYGTWLKSLERVKIDTLILERKSGDLPRRFGKLLCSLPRLKVLKFMNWELRSKTWDDLVKPEPDVTLPLPKLEELYIYATRLADIDSIIPVVENHPLRKVVIGGYVPVETIPGREDDEKRSVEQVRPDIVEWLNATVPEVHVSPAHYIPPEERRCEWGLYRW